MVRSRGFDRCADATKELLAARKYWLVVFCFRPNSPGPDTANEVGDDDDQVDTDKWRHCNEQDAGVAPAGSDGVRAVDSECSEGMAGAETRDQPPGRQRSFTLIPPFQFRSPFV